MITETIKLITGRDDVTLTTYIRDNIQKEVNPQMKRPAVIICPGGAYFNCSDGEGESIAISFMEMGYHAFVLRYSVYNKSGKEMGFGMKAEDMEIDENSLFPNPMLDIGRAFVEIHKHANEWGVDTDHMAVCGFSAGAHNCAMYSTYWSTTVAKGLGVDPQILQPHACILGYCLSDYVYMKEMEPRMAPMDAGFFKASARAYLGDNYENDESLLEVSPARNVNSQNPPTYLWATAEDNLVPVQHTIRMAHALADHKIPFELHIYEKGPHGLSNATQSSAAAHSLIYPEAATWVPLCNTWLLKRFALQIPDVTPWEDLMENGLG